jgi:two-component system chemotaxis sensor kinase CheA
MSPLLLQFLTEGRDFLEQIAKRLLILEETPDDEALVGDLFRFVHTLKGNSGLFDLPILTRVVHAAEDLLDRVREHDLDVTSELTDDLLSAMDFIGQLLDEIEDSGAIAASNLPQANELIERLRSLLPEARPEDEEARVDEALPAPTDWRWVARMEEHLRADILAQTPTAPLLAMRYLPEPQCFFKGEDPLLLLRRLPGLAGFSIRAAQEWAPLDEMDIYTSNLLIDALSTADRAELEEHLRYVPEQVAVYPIPHFALAIPTGDAGNPPEMYADALESVLECLTRGDRARMRAAIEATLDMINPALWTASALRWCLRLEDVGADVAVMAFLMQATFRQEVPDWCAFSHATSTSGVAEGPQTEAEPGGEDAASPAWTMSDADTALWDQIFETQRKGMAMPSAQAQWAGRLASFRNTLAALFRSKGDVAALASLDASVEAAEQENSFEPILQFLDARKPAANVAASPSMNAVAPVVVELAAERDRRETRRAGGGVPEVARRATDGSADRGVRVLKVSQEKVDRLMDLIGEMVVAKNALPYLATRAEDFFGSRELGREIKSQYAIINRIAEEMQDGIMQIRMLPVDAIFQRFPRLVRDVAKQLGKKVRLTIEGQETEADKNMIEALGDPMIHILRNSLDHGIEMPDVRAGQNKPEEGRLTVRANQEGDRVLIEIEDDGKGIDPAVIKRKAFEKGLIDEQRLETISDAEAIQLVFAAGFSTAETVSNLSGRGVGMDVVRSSIEKVGGQVQLTSERGKGTKIMLSLPLSMSVSNVMMVDIGGQNFGVPMDVVVETVRVSERDIHVFKQRRTAVLRGRIVPLYSTDELLATHNPPKPNADGEYAVLVARVRGETVGIVVDGFAQTIDVILKPLEGPLAGLAGFAGSALLGNGGVLLVLDIKELI